MIDTHQEFSLNGMRASEVLSPRDAGELARALAGCNEQKRAVVPWGGGTLQHLGNMPIRYDAVLQTTGLNQLVEYAADDLTATFGAGMTLAAIDRVLSENNQFLPLDVPHPERATIGGVLATGVNGGLRLRYGPARDYMLGNRFATVDGQIIRAGSKVVKNVAGYELHKVQVGAFGTLGILTEATFKLFPKPPAEIAVWSAFATLDEACAVVPAIWNLNTPPLAIELLDGQTFKRVERNAQGAFFVVARFGGSKATIAAARDLFGQAAEQNNATATESAGDTIEFWRAIANLPADLREHFSNALLVRISIPPKELLPALRLAAEFPAGSRIFAHAAVASIFVSFDDEYASPETFLAKLRAQVHELHGHLIVENAPPRLKQDLGAWDEPGASFRLMQALKNKFDPNNILNPGRFVGGL